MNAEAQYTKCADLLPGTDGHNLVVKVVDRTAVSDYVNSNGNESTVAVATVGDETACISMITKKQHVALVQPGTTLEIRNVAIDMYKGHMRLSVDRWSTIEVKTENALFDVNTSLNMSNAQYELVEFN